MSHDRFVKTVTVMAGILLILETILFCKAIVFKNFRTDTYRCEGNYIYTQTDHILYVYYVEPTTELISMEAMYSEGVTEDGSAVYWVQRDGEIEMITEDEFRAMYDSHRTRRALGF